MKRTIVLLLCLSLFALCAACQTEAPGEGSTADEPAAETTDETTDETTEPSAEPVEIPLGSLDSFRFSMTWGCYGISSYDSTTGKLVKSSDATHPEDYTTTYSLTEEQKQQIYDWIEELQMNEYPDTYDPFDGKLFSNPSMTLILSVQTDTMQKTIRAKDIAFTYKADNKKGQNFLAVCQSIERMLTETEEWKALPEYEFFYD